MSAATKILILTWLVIGFALFGGLGYYFGKSSAIKEAEKFCLKMSSGAGGQQLVMPGPAGGSVSPPAGGQGVPPAASGAPSESGVPGGGQPGNQPVNPPTGGTPGGGTGNYVAP